MTPTHLDSAVIRGATYQVGVEEITSIVVRANMPGPMGYYTMVYVYADGNEGDNWWLACPLHHCQEVTQ